MFTSDYIAELKNLSQLGINSFQEVEMDFIRKNPEIIHEDQYMAPLKDAFEKNDWKEIEEVMKGMISSHFNIDLSQYPAEKLAYFQKASVLTIQALNENNKTIGYTSFLSIPEFEKGQYRITALAVDNEYRRQGLAQKLIEKGFERIENLQEVFLSTRPSNEKAKSFYLKNGFSEDENEIQIAGHTYKKNHWVQMRRKFMKKDISRDEMNYLNMTEIKMICRSLKIPFQIHIEKLNGELSKTSDIESKSYLLDKIYLFLTTKRKPLPIIYRSKIISFEPFKEKYSEDDLLLFNDFKSTNKELIQKLQDLTHHRFKFGAIAFLEAHKLWRAGKTVSLKKFAKIWETAMTEHTKPLEEWAYLTDLQNGFDKDSWKKHRVDVADKLMKNILTKVD